MGYSNQGRLRQQINFLRRQFLQDGDLPFTNVLSEQLVSQALTAAEVVWNNSIYQPLVTLWVFLSQVLNADHSCRAAVARLIVHRLSQGQSECSAESGAYCIARKRLPEKFFSEVARQTGRALDAQVDPQWLWKGRRVTMFDGTTVSMPDTPENQFAYPQVDTQKPGLGFPIARIGTIISLSCGGTHGQLLDCIATHRVADRPDRFEPRLRKRRPKHYGFLRKPRNVIKNEMAKGLTEI